MHACLAPADKDSAIDADLMQQLDGECKYCRDILKRVVAVIKFLGERGLACGGDDERGSGHS